MPGSGGPVRLMRRPFIEVLSELCEVSDFLIPLLLGGVAGSVLGTVRLPREILRPGLVGRVALQAGVKDDKKKRKARQTVALVRAAISNPRVHLGEEH